MNETLAFATQVLENKRITLVLTGGIAAYKSLDLIRRLRDCKVQLRCIMTKAAHEFVTPLSVSTLCGSPVFCDLFDRNSEFDVGHIRLARDADLIIVAPCSADFMAKLSHGLADDLASATLLASDRPVLIAPAMNPKMWENKATQRNFAQLIDDGFSFVGPERGEMAESAEAGLGRMSEVMNIILEAREILDDKEKPLTGKKFIITSGPTHEPIDPVRYIANRSSGKQGHAIASALAQLGATVHLVSGPVSIDDPRGVKTVHVQSAREMHDCVEQLLPANGAIFVAAVADYRVDNAAPRKIKKQAGKAAPELNLVENPDILATIGHHAMRPELVIGFAAETNDVVANGQKKLAKKGADFILANDVSKNSGIGGAGVMGGDSNRIEFISTVGVESWPQMSKQNVAKTLAQKIANHFASQSDVI